MKRGGIDRRVNRTRALLQKGLLSLISEKSYEAITVQDVCEAANVGRSTFYAHYTSKDDLKRSGIDDHLRKLLLERQREALDHSASGIGRPFGFSLAMFEHARDHKEHYRALAGGPGRSVALGAIREVLSDLVRNELSSASPGASPLAPPRDLTVHFVTGAYMAVLTWWLDGGAKLTPETMDAMFRHLATQGVIGSEAKHSD